MVRNNINSLSKQFNDISNLVEANRTQIMSMANEITKKSSHKKIKGNIYQADQEVVKPEKSHTRKNKSKTKQQTTQQHTISKDRDSQLLEQQRRQQEASCNQLTSTEQEEALNHAYWQEAMILSEIVGPPVAKRRRAHRMGRM
ncbi:MAG: hypothetical protein RR448_01475 [Niameybacter sp.]|uniref:hypothetical protein n=1 Tax=Niameybacter sp. TaxID=2033640 RepID=UPI002FC6EEF8